LPSQAPGSTYFPTINASELQRQLPDAVRTVFEATANDPFVGVIVMTDPGRIEYMNDQCARMLAGDSSRASDMVGRTVASLFPRQCALECEESVRHIRATRRSVCRRKIWLGSQLFIVFSYLSSLPGTPAADVILCMTHRVRGYEPAIPLGPETDQFESGVVRLGRLDILTKQELRVMALVGRGMSVRQAAKALHRAEKTVESHCVSIHRKLGISDRVEMASLAQEAGLTLEDAERVRV
jgi:DNA-binding CsgD family transcriptional regulator